MKTRTWRILNAVAICLVVAYGILEFVVPALALSIWREDYQTLMFECDHVMREHFIAKQAVMAAPSEISVRNLGAAEVGLMRCHEYDKIRKKLLSYRVSEADLSMAGLEAMEAKAQDVRKFVEIHEIRY